MSILPRFLRRPKRVASVSDPELPPGGDSRFLFAFTGGSAAWPAMGRGLYVRSQIVRHAISEAGAVVEQVLGWPAAARFEGFDEPADSLAVERRNEVIHLGMLQLAQVDLWRSEGIVPNGVVSVSLGEMVAPYAAGAISRADCARILAVVAHAISRTSSDYRMFILDTASPETERVCRSSPVQLDYLGSVSPNHSVALCRATDVAVAREAFGAHILREVGTDWNYHTPRLDVDRAWMREQLAGVTSQPPTATIYSAAAGGRLGAGATFDAAFYAWMVSRPFRFADAVAAALADGFRTVINIGPHPANNNYLSAVARVAGHTIRQIDTMRNGDDEGAWTQALGAVRALPVAPVGLPVGLPPVSAATISLTDLSVQARLFEVYEVLRATGTPSFLARNRVWIVLDFESVHRALSQAHLFSSHVPIMERIDPVLLGNDPPAHTEVRRLLMPYFSADAIAHRAGIADRTAVQLLEPLKAGEEIDAIADFVTPLTQAIAADLVGVPADLVKRVAERTLPARGDLRSVYELLEEPFEEMASRTRLYHDLLRDSDGTLGADEARSLVRFLWVTATTPKRVLGSAILLLLENPDIHAMIERRPELLEAFVDEAIRLRPAEHLLPRVTTAETQLGGVTIPSGVVVQLCVAAANRDPQRFPDPTAIRLDRSFRGHLSFGAGVHRCIGASLGRSVILAGLRALLQAAPGFRAAQPLATVRYAPGATFRELEQLVIAPC